MNAQKDRLYDDVKFLTEVRPYRNYQNIESLKTVSNYIKEEFIQAGLTVEEQQWFAQGEE